MSELNSDDPINEDQPKLPPLVTEGPEDVNQYYKNYTDELRKKNIVWDPTQGRALGPQDPLYETAIKNNAATHMSSLQRDNQQQAENERRNNEAALSDRVKREEQVNSQLASLGVNVPNQNLEPPPGLDTGIKPTQPTIPGGMGPEQAPQSRSDVYSDLQKKESAPYEQEKAINLQMQGPLEQKAKDEADAASDNSKNLELQAIRHQAHAQHFSEEMGHIYNDMKNGHINPNQFLENQSTGSKIATAIGMVIAGAGSGILHQENPVIKFLDSQIDRNIEAQKANLGQKNNAMTALIRMGESESSAEELMKGINLQVYKSKLDDIAAKSNLALTGPKIKLLNNAIDQKLAEVQNKYSLLKSTQQGMADGTLNPELLPKDRRERYVRGFGGLASTSGEATKFREDYLPAANSTISNLKAALDIAKQNGSSVDPKLKAKAAEKMAFAVGEIAKGLYNRVTEVEIDNLKKVIGNPTDIFQISNSAVIEDVINHIQDSIDDRAKGINLDPPKRLRPPTKERAVY